MKRVYTILIFLLAVLSSSAQESPKELWIYRNDGVLHGFRAELIDSIICSKLDLDSTHYDDYVVQEIWMEDSVCRIPLNAIDSIGFTTPSTIYKNDVLEICDALREYVLSASSSEIQLERTCPEHLLPQVGQKIATTKIDANFPSGFMGKVSSIERSDTGIVLHCQETMLSEIFDRYYTTFDISFMPNEPGKARKKTNRVKDPFFNDEFNCSIPYTASVGVRTIEDDEDVFRTLLSSSDDISTTIGNYFKIEGTLSTEGRIAGFFAFDGIRPKLIPYTTLEPLIDLSFTIAGNKKKEKDGEKNEESRDGKKKKNYAKFHNENDWTYILNFARSGEWLKEWEDGKGGKRTKKELGRIFLPIGPTGVVFELVAGVTFSGEALIGGGWSTETDGEYFINYSYTNNPNAKQNMDNHGCFELKNFEIHPNLICGEASFKLGLFGEFDISLLEERIDKVGLRLEGGAQLGFKAKAKAEHVINRGTTTEMYDDFINDCGLNISPYSTFSIVAGLGPLEIPFDFDIPLTEWFPNLNINLANFVPRFTTTDYFKNQNIGLKGIVYPMSPVGYKVVNGEGETIYKKYHDQPYGIVPLVNLPLPFNSFPVTIPEAIKIKKGYKIYPLVKPFNLDLFEMTASPAINLLPIQISSVTTTAAQYRPTDHPQHFIYKDKPSEFKYNVATTVTLTDDEGVENWGYCYKGPENDSIVSRISLKGAPHTYEDTRFPYYRNGSPTTHTARLYPFVKYTGDDKYYYGEPVDYPLVYPDTSTVKLTGCSTGDVVTRENVEYNGVKYDYCSTFILDYNATGAYWITVGAEEIGNGWSGWDNSLPARERARATDGSNRLTINYYYNQKVLEGDYKLRIKGTDEQHGTSCTSPQSVKLTHNGKTFTGCEIIQ